MTICGISARRRANLSGRSGPSLPLRVVRVLVLVALTFSVPICGQYNQNSCGQRKVDISFVIHGGEAAVPGYWPWHAAIYKNFGSVYTCGGSILNSRTILTVAHCLFVGIRQMHTDQISVHVGRVDLEETTDGLQVLAASEIIPHPEYRKGNEAANDIGIVKLSTDIEWNRFVQPVCLWNVDDGLDPLVGKNGILVGFGLNEYDELPGTLQEATLTVVDVYTCLENSPETYGRLLTRGMFCAGGKPGVSACKGDSGGGMFFEKGDRWYVRGIVSFIATQPSTARCDNSKYTVFTDVGKYLDWIHSHVDTSRSLTNIGPSSYIDSIGAIDTPQIRQEPVLQQDNIFRAANRFDNSFLLVSGYDRISRVSLNGGQSFTLFKQSGANGIDHDCAGGRFYWSDYATNQIHSANYDGTDRKAFITEDILEPHDVTVDWISRRLYWADWQKGTIEVASLDDPDVRTVLISGNQYQSVIAVDPLQRKLYWSSDSSSGNEEIQWSNLDGSERKVLDGVVHLKVINNMKAFKATGQLCYADERRGKIECVDPYSKQIRTIASNLNKPWTLAITDERIYWTELAANRIESINLNGVRQQPIAPSNLDLFYTSGMTAVTDKCPPSSSPCAINNGGCPFNTICLVNQNAPAGRTCLIRKK